MPMLRRLGVERRVDPLFDLSATNLFSHGSNGVRPFASIAASSMKLA